MWVSLVDRYDSVVRHAARRLGLGPSDIADVSQMTWIRLHRHVDQIRQPDRLCGWLKTTSHNEALTLIRRNSKRQQREAAVDPMYRGSDDGPEPRLIDAERSAELNVALGTLSAEPP